MAKIKDIISNLPNVTPATWVRLITTVVALVNLALTAVGKPPIKIDNDELYTVISVIFAAITGVIAFWKNNSFTSAACAADEYLHNCGTAIEDPGEEENA